ncbi:MAG: CBS domain-containing protein [Saprospiraceae bacterium]|nr:CBS domain-containing protein [Saprospiraceae bacterium]
MNFQSPISDFMTKQVITVSPEDTLVHVKEIFDKYTIHHLPVVNMRMIEGIISKTDLMHFLRGFTGVEDDNMLDEARLRNYQAKDIMTTRMAKVDSTDRINVALEVFKINRFHALPVVDNGELVGILTTHDIISALVTEDPVKAAF